MTVEEDTTDTALPGLVEILEFRDATYSSLTDAAILPHQDKLTSAVHAYLQQDSSVVWSDMNLIKQLAGFITITGYIFPKLGESVRDGNSQSVIVTRENVSKFRSLLRFVLPVNLLEIGTIDQMVSFMRELTFLAAKLTEVELQAILEVYDCNDLDSTLISTEHATAPEQIATPVEPVPVFNDITLTEDQVKRMQLYSNITSDTRH